MKWIPLLFLAACATDAEYQRGAYRPPARAPVRAPTTNPTTDAPRFAPPGHMPMPGAYPRSPHTRLLPPTKEPGLWAGDAPRASASGPTKPKLEIAGVELPVPEPQWRVNALEGYAPHLCHGLITHNAFSPGAALNGDAFTPEQKACLIATWYKQCLSWAAEAIVDPRKKGIATSESQFWRRYVDPASKFEKEKCTPEILNSKDRHGRDSLKERELLPAGYWDDVYKSYQRTRP